VTGDGLLSGVTVLDLTRVLAGPYATQLLADLGAHVIKIEPPEGDSTRRSPPHYVGDTSAYFLGVNRGKQSVVVNLKHPRGRDLVLRLAQTVDLVIENFRPGVMDRLGIGFEALRAVHRGVVLCSISGFGQDGPYRDRPAFDVTVQAMSGAMSITGEEGGRPVLSGIAVGDVCAGMFAVIGALAGLEKARSTGEAQHIDVSMLDGQISMLSYQAVFYLVSGIVPGPRGTGHPSFPIAQAFACSDGAEIHVSAIADHMWPSLCTAIEREDLLSDPRFVDAPGRRAHKAALLAELAEVFCRQPASHWLELLNEFGVPTAPVNTLDQMAADPQVQHRRMLVDMDYAGQRFTTVGNPIKVQGQEQTYVSPPRLGEHTRQVLTERLGLTRAEIGHLADEGVIGVRRGPR
jgi:crotonobetainyl-CoA:carnitine CoA-transferase CaiB-like acyl-CoA transferase